MASLDLSGADRFHELETEYEFISELGRGGTSVVYLARERELLREVAIKVVRANQLDDPEASARLAREAKLVALLRHPNIVPLLGTRHLSDGRLALIMQHVPGRTLKSAIRDTGPLTIPVVEHVLREIGSALEYAHRRHSIVHRDIKPENIYLDEECGRALLSDFGIARPGEPGTDLTMVGTALGTPAYMSPEQIDGIPLDGRSDLFSLGLVAYEMLTGEQPWAGSNLYSIIYKQKHEELPPLAQIRQDVPPYLQRLVASLLHKDRDKRIRDAAQLLTQLPTMILPLPQMPTPADAANEIMVSEDSPTIRYRRPAQPSIAAHNSEAASDATLDSAGVPGAEAANLSGQQDDTTVTPVLAAGASTGAQLADAESGDEAQAAEPAAADPVAEAAPAAVAAGQQPIEEILAEAVAAGTTRSRKESRTTLPKGRSPGRSYRVSTLAPGEPAAATAQLRVHPPPGRRSNHDNRARWIAAATVLLLLGGTATVVAMMGRAKDPDLRANASSSIKSAPVQIAAPAIALPADSADHLSATDALRDDAGVNGEETSREASVVRTAAAESTPPSRSSNESQRAQITAERTRARVSDDRPRASDARANPTAQTAVQRAGNQPETGARDVAPANIALLGTEVHATTDSSARRVPEQVVDAGEAIAESAEPGATPFTVRPALKNREAVQRALASHYPRRLRESGVGGTVTVWALVDENGSVVRTQVKFGSGNQQLNEAALKVAETMSFTPALNQERRVKVWIEVPLVFKAD